jgi:hypothetical protein
MINCAIFSSGVNDLKILSAHVLASWARTKATESKNKLNRVDFLKNIPIRFVTFAGLSYK